MLIVAAFTEEGISKQKSNNNKVVETCFAEKSDFPANLFLEVIPRDNSLFICFEFYYFK